jgi:hypothetical protein
MMKFREKWFWALCLAILVHAGAFLVFYLNTNQADTAKTANNGVNTAKPAAVDSINLPPTDKVYTTTVTTTKTLDNLDNSPADTNVLDKSTAVTNSTSNDAQTTISENIQTVSSQTSNNFDNNLDSNLDNNFDSNPKKAPNTSAKLTQDVKDQSQEHKRLKAQKDEISQPIITSTDDNLETIKSNAGLLEMDVPAQKSTVKIDKDYLSAKSEVEEINDQLSAAINEVKKRNQQKIDEQQQLRNEANIKDSQNLTENSN